MERRINPHKAKFRRQVAAGRYGLLALTGLTLVNLLLLICRVEYHFLLSGAAAYYVNWLCQKLDASFFWTALAALFSVGVTVFYGACCFLSRRRRIFLTAALAGYALDTLLLLIFTFTLVENPASCVLEIITHLAVLLLLMAADQAAGALQRMRQRARV